MTYILGSRCRDGVVLISDRKFTIEEQGTYLYDDKLYAEIRGVITGFAGTRSIFELFRAYLIDKIITYSEDKMEEPNKDKVEEPNNEEESNMGMPMHKLILTMSELMTILRKNHQGRFEALIAFSETKSYLKYLLNDSSFETINGYKSIA